MTLPIFAHPELPLPDPALSVFINCPFDDEYEPFLDAIVFTAVCCGFQPRTADESLGADVSRMDRILHAVFTSKYSIHDLSRCKGEGEELLARFNMPLELGLALGYRFVSTAFSNHKFDVPPGKKGATTSKLAKELEALGNPHRWLVLVPESIRVPKYISDLAGYDLESYDGMVGSIIERVTAWLMSREGAVPGMSPGPIKRDFSKFLGEKAALKSEWGRVRWPDLLKAARNCVPKL